MVHRRPSPASASTRSSVSTASMRSRSPSPAAAAGAPSGTDAAVKTILDSRKCWRSLKGKEEPVWPPPLEAALIAGLERYKPQESKSTRTLGRFPMRNKFVADHIFAATGVRRTPKQVGSRIQQLRDTNSGKQILKVISDRHYEMMHPKRPSTSSASPHAASPHAPLPPAPPAPSHVYVHTLPASAAWHMYAPHPTPLHPTSLHTPTPLQLAPLHAREPRPLRLVDPGVTFSSGAQTPCQALCTVFCGGRVVHREAAPVSIRAAPAHTPGAPAWVYSTALVPGFWGHLCDAEDPGAYVVHQEVVRVPAAHHAAHAPLLSVFYHFVNAAAAAGAATPPLSPRSSCDGSETEARSSLSRSSSPNACWAPLRDDGDAKPFLGVYAFDDAYAGSAPTSPLDAHWGYGAPPAPPAMHDVLACDAAFFEPYLAL